MVEELCSKQYNSDKWSLIAAPQYNTHASRMESYKGWPRWALKSPIELSKAGLYYLGT
jgi:hypothetical protein